MAPVIKNPSANAGEERDTDSIPRPVRSPGGGHGNPFQHSCLENPMDWGTWWATVHGVARSPTWLMRQHPRTLPCLSYALRIILLIVVACGILFPDQGSNPGPRHWEHEVLTNEPPGSPPMLLLLIADFHSQSVLICSINSTVLWMKSASLCQAHRVKDTSHHLPTHTS